jgi:hypothetical protein
VAGGGLVWLAQISTASTFLADLFGPFVLIGLGMGLAVTPIAVAGTAGVARAEAGLASGLLNTSRTVGAAIGLAALATVAANRTSRALAGSPAHAGAALTDGYALSFLVGAGLLLVTALVALATLPGRSALHQAPAAAQDEVPGTPAERTLQLEQA